MSELGAGADALAPPGPRAATALLWPPDGELLATASQTASLLVLD